MALPIIDLGQIVAGDPESAARVAQQLRHAAETSGFFYLKHHGVPKELIGRCGPEILYVCVKSPPG